MKKIDYEYVKSFIEYKGCELLSDVYKNNKDKLIIKCKCGDIFQRSFGDYKNKKMYYCKCCSGKKITFNDVKLTIESHGLSLLTSKENYKNASQKLDIKCSCGNIYKISFSDIKRFKQYNCPKCSDIKRVNDMKNKDIDNLNYYNYNQVKSIINNTDSKLLSTNYNTCYDKLELKCSCGKTYYQSFTHISNKIKTNKPILCPDCMKNISDDKFRLNECDIKHKIMELYGYEKFKIVDFNKYKNNKTKIEFIHADCGHKFYSTLHNILVAERSCPNCENNHTLGIRKIIKFLENNNITYELEKKFNDCKYKRLLPFDIYLNSYNALIEFDGEQHYKSIDYFGGDESFELCKIRDNIKNEYCKNKNIPLLRIKYNQINQIDSLLKEYIDKLIPS